jgi:hypothetical protein
MPQARRPKESASCSLWAIDDERFELASLLALLVFDKSRDASWKRPHVPVLKNLNCRRIYQQCIQTLERKHNTVTDLLGAVSAIRPAKTEVH